MRKLHRSMFKMVLVSIVFGHLIAGCVTETNDPLAQNRDPSKAAKTYVEAGTLYMQQRQMDNAARTLKRAEALAPNDPGVNNALALFYSIEGEDEQVERYFKKALSIDPEFSQARNNYAAYLFQKQRYDKAVEHLERVVKDYRYQRRYTAYENLGICYLKLGDKDGAKEAFGRALQLNPNMPNSLIEMGVLSMDEGNNLLAAKYLKKYESISQPSPKQLWLGIRLQRILGDKNKLSSYELALKNLFPGSDEYQAYKASL
jgi:type IV pilus assembly protein PilF